MLSLYYKIKNFRLREVGAKGAAIFLINKKLSAMEGGDKLGKITDLQLNRTDKSMVLEATRDAEINSINVKGYKTVLFKGKSFITWDSMEFNGNDRSHYQKIFKNVKRIEISKQVITLLKVIL